ncbi:hypothetical protein DFQ01_13054 [Paenibacillus cellulosilyticus]|uniref:Acetyltransferase (GNAT) family protein n=1 Tax=Paenibacillus cellulosilyticus TaxID=375489 RepID=A0A2V2YLI3_9BACL|nr:hypothetical protein [Paenibacillus cellulosilyticus]PWV94489.1 hypothetical protein DFQ01_13054 [Paenibacillus cellulosilyticus]QKS45001.1 hypothetical protein HUB94_11695 [Paenibacillus cellulosilyticus]
MEQLTIRQASAEEASSVLELWQMSARWLDAKGINQWRPEREVSLIHEWDEI